jgi:hypothetical protein
MGPTLYVLRLYFCSVYILYKYDSKYKTCLLCLGHIFKLYLSLAVDKLYVEVFVLNHHKGWLVEGI